MNRPYLPLNNLRAFEVSARHLSFTKAATELRVTPAALSHQVKALEERLGFALFRRNPRGLALTEEGSTMLPVLEESFDRIAHLLQKFDRNNHRAKVSVGVVGTFAVSWLFPWLESFEATHPSVDLRLTTYSDRTDLTAEAFDFAIQFGDGEWQSTVAEQLLTPEFSPLCVPKIARRVREPRLTVKLGSYYLTRLKSRPLTPPMTAFRTWILGASAGVSGASGAATKLPA